VTNIFRVQILHCTHYLPEDTSSALLSEASSPCEIIKDLETLNKLHYLVNFAFESIEEDFFHRNDIWMTQLTQNFEFTLLGLNFLTVVIPDDLHCKG
jgi:hypothetical protein